MTWTTRLRSRAHGLALIRAGAGPRLLLVHGVGLRAEAWNAQIADLLDRFELLAPDLPGHGQSPRLAQAQPSLSDYGAAIAPLIDRPTVLIGHSMGAMIALDLAVRHSEHIRGVVALNAIFHRAEDARLAVRQRAHALDEVSVADPAPTLDRWFGTGSSPERAACENWLKDVDPSGYRDAYRVFASEDGPGDDALRTLDCPALFMTGGREPNSTPAMSKAMAGLAPDGLAMILDTAAHMTPMTHAAEVNTALRGFAERCLA